MNPLPSPSSVNHLNSIENIQDITEQSIINEDSLSEAEPADISLFTILHNLGVINSRRTLLNSIELPYLPPINSAQFAVVKTTLDQTIFTSKISLRKILHHILSLYGQWIPKIELVGGFVRKLILESPEYISNVLEHLTGLSDEEIQPCIDQITNQARQRQVPDIDIRIYTTLQTEEDLKKFTQCVVDYLNLYFYNVTENLLSKFNVIFEDNNRYSIATIKTEIPLEYELLFITKLNRTHLFSHDSLCLPLLPFLFEQKPIYFESSIEEEWQSLIYLMTQTIDIQSPETVDHFGFPILLSYLIQGYVPINIDDIRILEKQTFKELNLHPDPIYSLYIILSKTVRNHHFNDSIAANILTLTCSFHLNCSEEEKIQLITLMRSKYWKHSSLLDIPLLKEIDEALNKSEVSISILSAALTFSAIINNFHDYRLPIEGSQFTLYLPMSLEEAMNELLNHLKSQEPSELILNLIFDPSSHIISEKCFSNALDIALKYTQSKSRKQRFLGYALLIPLGSHPENFLFLLENFIDTLYFIPSFYHEKFLLIMVKKFGSLSPFAIFHSTYEPEAHVANQLSIWVQILLEDPETCHIANMIWLQYRLRYKQTERYAIDSKMILELLPQMPEKSLQLFELIQEDSKRSKNELSLLNSVLRWILHQPPSNFTLFSPQIADIISQALIYPNSRRPKRTIPPTFLSTLAEYISILIEEKETDLAYTLLSLAAKHPELQPTDSNLYECWLKLSDNPSYPTDLWLRHWNEISLLGPCPSELINTYQRVHFILIEQLLHHSEGFEEGFRQLRLYAKSAPLNQHLPIFAQRDIQQLIETEQTHLALQIFEDLYQVHFQNEDRQGIRKQLFDKFLQLNSPTQAYVLWKEIQPDYPETTKRLLHLLTQENAPRKHLKKAYQWILAELKDQYLTPDECFPFYLKIYHQDPSQRLLAILLKRCFENNLSDDHKLETIFLVTSTLNNFSKPISSKLEKVISSFTDHMLKLLLVRKNYHEIDQLVELLICSCIDVTTTDCFYQLSQKLTHYYLDQHDVSKLIQWMYHALNYPDLFTEWLPDLLHLCENLEQPDEALIYVEFTAQIKEAIPRKKYCNRTSTLLNTGEVDFEIAILLLNSYPPMESSPWDSLLHMGNEDQFEKIWDAYYSWLCHSPKINGSLLNTTISMINRFSHLTSRPESTLIASLNSPNSPLGRLVHHCDDEILSLHEHLLLSLARHIQTKNEFIPFYNKWFDQENQKTKLIDHQAFILDLIDHLITKSEKHLLLFCLEIFSVLIQQIHKSNAFHYSEEIHSTLMKILLIIESNDIIKNPNFLFFLKAISKITFNLNLLQHQRLDIASALGSFEEPDLLDESINFLLPLETSPDSQKIWEHILPKYLKLNFDLSLREEREKFFDFYHTHIDQIDKHSNAYFQCVNQLFALTIQDLYNDMGMLSFTHFLPTVFRSFFRESIPFEITQEEVFNEVCCPVLSIKEESSEKDHMEFFFYMSSFLSMMVDQNPVMEQVEEYIQEFLFRNLQELCAHFPNEHNCLVDLLDRYYFRYPPSVDPIFPSHIERSVDLLFEAIGNDLYDEHYEKMKGSVMYLQFKTCMRKNVLESISDQYLILENIIDRTLAFKTPAAVIRAVIIMQGIQRIIIGHNHKSLLKIYQKIINCITIDPFFIYQECTLFEWVRMGMMQKNPIIGYSTHYKGLITATKLCELLFEKVYKIFQSIELFNNAPRYSGNALLQWLGEFLILSRQHGAYRDINGAKHYYARVNSILPYMIEMHLKLTHSPQDYLAEFMTYAIAGGGFSNIEGLTNKIKLLRCKLMSNWLITISSSSECLEKMLEICKHYEIYTCYPKQYRKMLNQVKK